MPTAKDSHLNISPMYIKPRSFADCLSIQQDYCLFLDIDGTLADFTLNPKDSIIPAATLSLIKDIQSCGVDIGVVTGRSLAEAKQMLSSIQVPIAATHGLEIEFDRNEAQGTNYDNSDTLQFDNTELSAIKLAIIQSCKPYKDFTIEDKPYSVALHYRQNPDLADTAYAIMAKRVKSYVNWTLQQGKYVWEAVPKGADKGAAILTLLKKMQTDHKLCPIFIGDDITDEAGFRAIQQEDALSDNTSMAQLGQPIKGMGIKVGSGATCAHYYVHDITEVTVLLRSFLDFCQNRATLLSESSAPNDFITKKTTRCLI
ncbi:trehalose-phosphatase [Psychrobacter sp. FBL11]|uniref:Trehalose 6-phosphate phosphatase n=1 Tax=Psychrobacter saeujeotis TaxID=3143436 RepID=A0ABU9X8G4_9GAMM|nr:trehalose-phosphatase [uncultured Psychrobacter sp.]